MVVRFSGWMGAVLWGCAAFGTARAVDHWGPPLAVWLPEETLLYHEDADSGRVGAEATAMERFYRLPAMSAFRDELDRIDRETIAGLARDAQLEPVEVEAMFKARRSLALLDVAPGPDGTPNPVAAALFRFTNPPDPQRLSNAIRAYANQPRYIEIAQQRGVPLSSICWEETWPEVGNAPVLMLAGDPPVRIVRLGPVMLVYYGPIEPLRRILALAADPTAGRSLWRSAGFQAVLKGSGAAETGGAFFYANAARGLSLLATAGQERIGGFLEEIGFDTVHALGFSGAASGDGWRHNLYLYTPGPRSGMLAAVHAGVGDAEQYAGYLPGNSGYAFAGRMDWRALWGELPAFLRSARRLLDSPDAFLRLEKALAADALGVPVPELLVALGDYMALVDGPDGPLLRFEAARLDTLAELERRIGQSAGFPFQALAAGRHEVRYLNRVRGASMWAAPSWSVYGTRPEDPRRGAVLLGAYPQALTSILTHPPAGTLSSQPDFAKAALGVGAGQGVFLYLDNRQSYRRVYNALLPLASLAASGIGGMKADPALLPPGSVLEPYVAGCAVGVRAEATGVAVTVQSPMGAGGLLVSLLDHMVVNNPTLAATLVSLIPDDWLGAAWGATP